MHPRFDLAVPPNGYVWWYLDALSDDASTGLTIIAFIGSVFSPYYAQARRRHAPQPIDPLNYCALNVALYRGPAKRWALTERPSESVERSASHLALGPSSLSWDGSALHVAIDEITAPLPSRLRGRVSVYPEALSNRSIDLDRTGRHRWQAIAPAARVEVAFTHPDSAWQGLGYLDSNAGDAPLETGFERWTWSRAPVGGGTVVLYDVVRHGGDELELALHFDARGRCEEFAPPPRAVLPRVGWGIDRTTRSERGYPARIVRTLEDTPFYARSLVNTQLLGQRVTAVHESLSLDRFAARWVQALLPFRMPRFAHAAAAPQPGPI